MTLLRLDNVGKSYGGVAALRGLSLTVAAGEIVGLMGANGAGKTTAFSLIAGTQRPTAGEIWFDGTRIDRKSPYAAARLGIARTFQIVRPFGELSLEDNVLIGCLRAARHVDEARAAARQILERLDLWTRRHQRAANLTLPDRKRLEVARALGTGPKLLLLDEVMAGLRPTETDQMVAFFREINRDLGITILLIEHVMRAVMALAQRVVVINYGKKIAEGIPEAVVRDPAVLDCYLGEEMV